MESLVRLGEFWGQQNHDTPWQSITLALFTLAITNALQNPTSKTIVAGESIAPMRLSPIVCLGDSIAVIFTAIRLGPTVGWTKAIEWLRCRPGLYPGKPLMERKSLFAVIMHILWIGIGVLPQFLKLIRLSRKPWTQLVTLVYGLSYIISLAVSFLTQPDESQRSMTYDPLIYNDLAPIVRSQVDQIQNMAVVGTIVAMVLRVELTFAILFGYSQENILIWGILGGILMGRKSFISNSQHAYWKGIIWFMLGVFAAYVLAASISWFREWPLINPFVEVILPYISQPVAFFCSVCCIGTLLVLFTGLGTQLVSLGSDPHKYPRSMIDPDGDTQSNEALGKGFSIGYGITCSVIAVMHYAGYL